MLKSILTIAAFGIILSAGAHGYSKSNDETNDKDRIAAGVSNEEIINQVEKSAPVIISKSTGKVVKSTEVKNIWKDMPSYDRYGNEITGKARKNMLENSLKVKNNESGNINNTTESQRGK